MTLRFWEGFENSNVVDCYNQKWAFASNFGFDTGRLHGRAGESNSGAPVTTLRTRSLGLQNTWVVGIGMSNPKTTIIDGTLDHLLVVKRGTEEQIRFDIRKGTGNTFKIEVRRGATLLGSSADYVPLSWHYFEFKFTLDPTTGSVEIRHNTVADLTLAGPIDTADSGLAGADVFEMSFGDRNGILFDDMYMLDTTGSINNDYLGDSVIEGRRPTGDDAPLQFTLQDGPGAGSTHWDALDTLTCLGDDALSYIFSNTVGHQDMLSFNSLSVITGQIHGVMVQSDARLDTTGSRSFKHIIRSNATLYTSPPGGSNHTVASTNVQAFYDIFETDPDTAVKWTISGVDSADFGVEVVS